MTSQDESKIELSLIAPTYNEKENIVSLVERVHKALSTYNYELIVVDDNSPDGTFEVARSLSSQYPVRVIVRTNERGLASAVVAGFNEARGEIIGVIDADLQHPPEAIPTLIDSIRAGADVSIGSRYVEGGGMEGWGASRRIISKGATTIARIALASVRRIKDPLSGFFLFRKDIIEGTALTPKGYKILLEVLVRGRAEKVSEAPYIFRERERGESNLTLRQELDFIEHIIQLAWFEGDLKRFIKFCIVGATGFGVNMGGYWILTRLAELYDLAALIIALETSILSNFTLNELWTFRDKRTGGKKDVLIRMVKFNLVSVGAICIYYAIFIPFTRYLGIYDLLALLVAVFVGLVWNFSVNFVWTWKVRRQSKD